MDGQTLIATLALVNLALYGALLCHGTGRRRPSTLSGFTIARLCQGMGWLILSLHALVPTNVGGPVAFMLLVGGAAMDASGWWESAGHPGARVRLLRGVALAIGAYIAVHLAFGRSPEAAAAAAPWVAVLLAAMAAAFHLSASAALARGWLGATLLRRLLAAVNVVLAAVPLAAALLAALNPDWLPVAPVQLLPGVLFILLGALAVNGAGCLLLGRDTLQAELDRLETVDPLTDVPNRRGFYHGLAPWLALARRPGQPTALVIVNLDGFKRVNDHYGHAVGDVVLKTLVDAVRRQLREADMIGRLGGAEFALLLPRTGLPEATLVAERIRVAVAALPVKAERAVINLTMSMGVTTIRAEDSTVSLFKRADEALQAAKLRGRNQVVAAEPPATAPDDEAAAASAAGSADTARG
ncbi:GGDEF domain-containing protein [Pseudoduganella armeniaca]|uniref:diguanylate cyclase n=1 Tax=Pseudoduganella armeniaca TaxID=2072590 RepID=A0A2R4C9H8_9BURK|nr:GGDEF domain-containing protein [Pseudoduganella armeniaca]AVR96294.1 GGDEF domain-containing protein [Pseudoduganella armeniaca]